MIVVLAGIVLARAPLLAVGGWHPLLEFAVVFLFLSQPYFLLRLVHHFHALPRWLEPAALGVAILGAATQGAWAGLRTGMAGISIYFVATLSYAALAFGSEARRARGVTGTRLSLSAAGTWLHVAIAMLYGLLASAAMPAAAVTDLARILGVAMFACYYAGLVGPRRLRVAWMRRASYTYFRDATLLHDASSDERAAALERAAGECVSSEARAVLLCDPIDATDLTVRTASWPDWRGARVKADDGLAGRAIRTRTPVDGRPDECEGALKDLAAEAGASVLVAPIATADRCWGVLLLVRRRGSLFPHDDIELLDVLCRHTAAALEHATVAAQARDLERQVLNDRVNQVQRIEALGQIARGIAHDFNNLLTAVSVHVGRVEADPRFDPALKAELDNIRDIFARASKLTAHLLRFSRQRTLQPRTVSLYAVIDELLPTLRRVLDSRIHVTLAAAPALVRAFVDPIQIEQIVLNLAVNARDAMPEGGELTIAVAETIIDESNPLTAIDLPPGRYAHVTVSDTGAGMDALTQRLIFEPFFTTKPAHQGTGLGLATVSRILEGLSGAITVESAPGAGTTFALYFPIARERTDLADASPARVNGGHIAPGAIVPGPPRRSPMILGPAEPSPMIYDAPDREDSRL